MQNIKITKTASPAQRPEGDLGFGKYFTDHMFCMNYNSEQGWHDPRIVPFENLSLSPATAVFHYGQAMFEGLKAYPGDGGKMYLFRPEKNGERINQSSDRLCMPEIPVEDFCEAVRALVKVDADWMPKNPGESLYIRPFIIATDRAVCINPSKTHLFTIILSPSGPYFGDSGLTPVGIWVEDTYVRAAAGGVGATKTGGNYAASLAAQKKAVQQGFSQVLWLDGIERKYIEEVGAMNIFFKVGDKVLTPALSDSILPGITRDSVITLCKDWGLEVEERQISIDEIVAAQKSGQLKEVFGTGTAAVIAPIGKLHYKGKLLLIGEVAGELSTKLYDTITGIQYGKLEDVHGWRWEV